MRRLAGEVGRSVRTVRRLLTGWRGQAPPLVAAIRAWLVELKRDLAGDGATPRSADIQDLPLWELWEHACWLGGIRAQLTPEAFSPLEAVNLALQGVPGWV